MSYIIRDQTKREHTAATPADVDRVLAELRKKFGDKFKFKIQAVQSETQKS